MARRKISRADEGEATPADAADKLPDLTPKQLAFVQGILAGKSATDAYRAAYECDTMSQAVVWKEASLLRSDRKIAVWIAAARQAHLGNARVSLDQHVQELERLKEIALASGNVGAAVQAEQLRGKALGHYVERYADVTPDPIADLREIAASSPELAEQLAKQHGIAWPATGDTKH
jgi:hypothetical protein